MSESAARLTAPGAAHILKCEAMILGVGWRQEREQTSDGGERDQGRAGGNGG